MKKIRIIFLGWKFLKLFFGVTQGDKNYLGRGRSRYWLGYFSCTQLIQEERWKYLLYPHNVGQREGYFNNSISGSGEKMYTVDQMCNMVDFWQTIFLQSFVGVYFIKLLESLSERIVLHFSLTYSFTHIKVNL